MAIDFTKVWNLIAASHGLGGGQRQSVSCLPTLAIRIGWGSG